MYKMLVFSFCDNKWVANIDHMIRHEFENKTQKARKKGEKGL